MRHLLGAAAITFLVAPACLPEAARAQETDFAFFEEALAPYGEWVNLRGYGACWHPDVEEDWAPYTNGYWAYTDMGWTWVSHEPFGSIVFHYGRWLLTRGGWYWVPGSEWGPAWVSWRRGGDNVGWAPLPPEVLWQPQRGISGWVDVHTEIGPGYYRFCSARDFCSPNLTTVLVRPAQNVSIMLRTENVTNIWSRKNVVYCGGPEIGWVRERAAMDVPILRVAREENVRRFYSMNVGGNFGTVHNFVYEGKLVLPAPLHVEVVVSQRNQRMRPVETEVSRGWYEDKGANGRLRSHFNQEWESREVAIRRNPAAYANPVLEVKVKPVSVSERQGVVSSVVSRGGIEAPTPQRPQHPSDSQSRPGPISSQAPAGKVPLKKTDSGKPVVNASGANPTALEPVNRPGAAPKGKEPTGAAGVNAGGGSLFNGDQAAGPLVRPGRPLPGQAQGAVSGLGGAKAPPLEPASSASGNALSPGGAPAQKKRTEPVFQTLPPDGSVDAAHGVLGGRPSPISGKSPGGMPGKSPGGMPGNTSVLGDVNEGFSGGKAAPLGTPGMAPSSRPSGLSTPQNAVPPRSNFVQGGSIPQAPVSGARSSVVPPPSLQVPQAPVPRAPAPAPVPRAPAPMPQAPPSMPNTAAQRGFSGGSPQGGGGSPAPARGNAPAANAAPPSSGASLGTVPASGTSQPGQKKKPGDPGYVPPQ